MSLLQIEPIIPLKRLQKQFLVSVIPEILVQLRKVLPIFNKDGYKENGTFPGGEREDMTGL